MTQEKSISIERPSPQTPQQAAEQPQYDQPTAQPQDGPQQDGGHNQTGQAGAAGGETGSNDPLLPGMLSATKHKINGGETTLLYSAPISDRISLAHFLYFQTFPCSLALCNSKALKQSTYVHLYEDRLEWNYPGSCCSTIYDNTGVMFLDRDIAANQTIPSCCEPFCSHCSIAPTCWDVFGTSMMLHGQSQWCFTKGLKTWGLPVMNTPAAFCCFCPMPFCGFPCCPLLSNEWFFFHHLENAQELKFRVRAQRKRIVEAGHAKIAQDGITM